MGSYICIEVIIYTRPSLTNMQSEGKVAPVVRNMVYRSFPKVYRSFSDNNKD